LIVIHVRLQVYSSYVRRRAMDSVVNQSFRHRCVLLGDNFDDFLARDAA